MKILLLILIFISFYNTIWCIGDICKSANQPVFIVIALDGFKNSYFEHTAYLKNFRETGAYTKFLHTQKFSNAFSSFQTVATGYQVFTHGIVGHELCTPDKKLKYSENMYKFRTGITPIWTLNEENFGVSACMMWPGSEFKYGKRSTTCSHLMTYTNDKSKALDKRFDQVIQWLNESVGSPNLVMIYIENPDKTAHIYGTDGDVPINTDLKNKLTQLDTDLSTFDQNLDSKVNLKQRKNIIFISDHGMENVAYQNLFSLKNTTFMDPICISRSYIVGPNKVQYGKINERCSFALFRKHCETRQCGLPTLYAWIFIGLSGIAVKEYFEQHKYISDRGPGVTGNTLFGSHGYEPDDDAIFMAKGSAFNTGVFMPFYLEDFYSLLAKLLKMNEPYEHDGKFSRVKPLIKRRKSTPPINWIYRFMIIFTLAIIHCGAIYHYGNVREQQLKRKAMERRERRERKKQKKAANR